MIWSSRRAATIRQKNTCSRRSHAAPISPGYPASRIIRLGLRKTTQSFANTVETVSAVRSGREEPARNLANRQDIVNAEIFGGALRSRYSKKGYATSIPTIASLNLATHDAIFGGSTRVDIPEHLRCDKIRRIVTSGTAILAAFEVFRSANWIHRPKRRWIFPSSP